MSVPRLHPFQYWLFTPESQWQPRGQMAYLTGVSTGNARGRHDQQPGAYAEPAESRLPTEQRTVVRAGAGAYRRPLCRSRAAEGYRGAALATLAD